MLVREIFEQADYDTSREHDWNKGSNKRDNRRFPVGRGYGGYQGLNYDNPDDPGHC